MPLREQARCFHELARQRDRLQRDALLHACDLEGTRTSGADVGRCLGRPAMSPRDTTVSTGDSFGALPRARPIVHLPTRTVVGWSIDRSGVSGLLDLDRILQFAGRWEKADGHTPPHLVLPWNPTVAHALESSASERLGPHSGITVQLPNTLDRTEFEFAVRLLGARGVRAMLDFSGDVATVVALHDAGLLASVRLPQARPSFEHDTPALALNLGMQLMATLAEAGIMVIVDGVNSADLAIKLRRAGVRFAQGGSFEDDPRTGRELFFEANLKRSYPLPHDESERLSMVIGSGVLDSPPTPTFDAVVRLVTRRCRTPIAAVSIVDHDRQWFKASVGLDVYETPRSSALCAHTITKDRPMIVEDALLDSRFANNPLVVGQPFLRSYLGVPLRASNGMAFGALCAIDTEPRGFDDDEVAEVTALAQLVTDSLELRQQQMQRRFARE